MTRWALIIRGSGLNATTVILEILVAFFLMPFIIECLGERVYGVWLLVVAFVAYYGLFDLGIGGAVLRFVSRAVGEGNSLDIREYISTAFWVMCICGALIIVVSAAAFFIAKVYFDFSEDYRIFRFAILTMGCGVGISFPFKVFIGVLNANLRLDLNRYVEMGQTLLRAAGTVVFLRMGYEIYGLVAAGILATLTSSIVRTWIVFKVVPEVTISKKFFCKPKIAKMFEYGISTSAQNMARLVISKIDPYIIAVYVNVTLVTYYGIAITLREQASEFIRATLGILFPLISQKEGSGDMQRLAKAIVLTTRITVIGSTFMSAMAILYSRQFLIRWLGENFVASYPYIVIFFIPICLIFGFHPCLILLNSTGKHRLVAYLEVMQGGIKLVLSLVLGYFYGGKGVALGTSIPAMFFAGLIWPYFACKKIELNSLVFRSKMLLTLVFTVILIFPVWFFLGRNVEATYGSVLSIVGIHTAWLALLGPFVLLPKQDREKLWYLLKRRFFARNSKNSSFDYK